VNQDHDTMEDFEVASRKCQWLRLARQMHAFIGCNSYIKSVKQCLPQHLRGIASVERRQMVSKHKTPVIMLRSEAHTHHSSSGYHQK